MARPQVIKLLKALSFVLGGLVAVAVLLAVTASLMFDAEAVKAQASRYMMEKKQRTLRIEGDLALSFWPSLGLKVSKVSLSEKASDQTFASAEQARLALRLLPLLERKLAVETVEVQGLTVHLIRHKDGSFNFDDLISKEKDESSPLDFDVAGVKLGKASLSYADEGAGRTIQVSPMDLSSGQIARAADGKLSLTGQLSVDKPALKGKLELVGHYRFDLDKKEYALDGLDMRTSGDMAGLEAASISLSADLVAVKSSGLEAVKFGLGAKGRMGGKVLELALAVPKLALANGQGGGEALTLTASQSGPAGETSGRLEVAGLKMDGDKLAATRVAFSASGGAKAWDARLASPLAADLGKLAFQLPALAGQLEMNDPAKPSKLLEVPLSGSLDADLSKPLVSLALNARADKSQLSGTVALTRFSPPAVEFSLTADHLNLDRYLPAKPTAAADAKPSGPAAVDFSFLDGLDASGKVRIGSLQYQGTKASNLSLDMKAQKGRLDVSPISASLYQGKLEGALTLESKENGVSLKQNMTGIAIGPLLKDSLKKDVLEGHGDVSLDLKTSGQDMAALTAALAGKAKLNLKDGAIKGINLAKSLRNLKSRLFQRQDTVQAADGTEKTDFTEMSASFNIAKGVAENRDLSAKSPFLRLAGSGRFDLPAQTMDYTTRVSVVASATGQGGGELADLKGITVPVQLTGSFQAPSFRLAFGEIAASLLKNRLGAAIGGKLGPAVSGKPEDAASGLLRGLLKR